MRVGDRLPLAAGEQHVVLPNGIRRVRNRAYRLRRSGLGGEPGRDRAFDHQGGGRGHRPRDALADALARAGGWQSVSGAVLDDIALARAIRAVFDDGSVTSLFTGTH